MQRHGEKAEERGRRAADSGSVGSRDERKSSEEGCGGLVFTGHRHTGHCGFVRQQLNVCDGLQLQTKNQGEIYII